MVLSGIVSPTNSEKLALSDLNFSLIAIASALKMGSINNPVRIDVSILYYYFYVVPFEYIKICGDIV